MNATRKVKLNDISANLTCKLCKGYLVDATTIIECLHSFCKSCIIKYLEKSADLEEKYFCPICEIQLHETKPLTSIRSDLMLQEIVYKLVPRLFKDEMSRRREFYKGTPGSNPSNQLDSGQVFDELYITSDDIIHLSMEYVTDDMKLRESTKRYLKCPAAVSVFILKKFLQGKYDLEMGTNIDIMFGDRILPDDFLLMDVAYKYSWTMNGSKPLSLRYRIKGQIKPVIKSEKTINDASTPPGVFIPSQPELQKKKVCNENGSNIMPSSEAKPNPIKIPGNGLISGEITIAPIKSTPTGKVKNRKRKHPNFSDIVIEIKDDMKTIAKKLKLPKDSKSQANSPFDASTAMEIIPREISKSRDTEEGKEVQLQISENGVMSARSVSFVGNAQDKVILNLTSTPNSKSSKPSPTTSQNVKMAEKLLLSGNFHSKTGPSGVTEIICDKPDPGGLKPIAPKPGYVTLNIPNPTNSMMYQNQRSPNSAGSQERMKKSSATNLDSSSPPSTNLGKYGKSPYDKKHNDKFSKPSLLEKLKNRIVAKGKDGENVIKAISDLGKLCNTSSSNGISITATPPPDGGSTKMLGVHTNPIISALSSHLHPPSKAKSSNNNNNNFPFPLNFPASSGMSVSMIPACTTSASLTVNTNGNTNSTSHSSQSNTPPKRISHQTTVVNGDLKFTTSPKQQMALNGDHHEALSKKPPKFFKSRHVTSPAPHKTPSPPQKNDIEIKRKTPGHMGEMPPKKKAKVKNVTPKTSSPNALAHMNLVPNQTSARAPQSSNNFSTVSSTNGSDSRPIPYPAQSTESIFSQQLKAMNGIQSSVPSADALNSSFGIAAAAAVAAAAANGNGLRPFLPENYATIPFGYGTYLSQIMLPQYYNAMNYAGVATTNAAPSNSAMTASLNLTKAKSVSPPTPGAFRNGKSQILNGLLSTESKSEAASTLDLTVAKSGDRQADKDKGKHHPLLSNLLNNNKDSESKTKETSPSPSTKAQEKVLKTPNGSISPSVEKKCDDKAGESGTAQTNGHTTKSNGESPEVRPKPEVASDESERRPQTKTKDEINGKISVTATNGSLSLVEERNNLSSPTSDMLLSQNNNNDANTSQENSSDKDSMGSSVESKLKKNLECANEIKEDKGKCNGNNNVPAHAAELNSNSGSA